LPPGVGVVAGVFQPPRIEYQRPVARLTMKHSATPSQRIFQMYRTPIPDLLANHALCRNCIAGKTAMTPDGVDRAIAGLSRTIRIDRYANGMCLECGCEALVFAVDRPPHR
jgi:hypothetical protein